jgi:hypothetical protein
MINGLENKMSYPSNVNTDIVAENTMNFITVRDDGLVNMIKK